MRNKLIQELTGSRWANVKKISWHVFTWLLPDDFPTSFDETLDDTEVEELIICARLTESQLLALWSYIYCIEKLSQESQVRSRANLLLEILLIKTKHRNRIRTSIDSLLKRIELLSDMSQLVENPPIELVNTITDTVVECIRSQPAQRYILYNLKPAEFEHDRDRDTLSFIRSLPGDVVAKAIDIIKRNSEIAVLSSGLLITEDSLPTLHKLYKETCEILSVISPPPLYLQTGKLRAYTVGIEEPIIVIESMALNLLDSQEVIFLLGRELGHIIAGHLKGQSLCRALFAMTGTAAELTFGISHLIDFGLQLKLYSWLRYANYTADRAGYLACQNMEASLRVMLKLSGFPMRHFNELHSRSLLEQADAFQKRVDENTLDKAFNFLGRINSDSNAVVVRTKHLADWVGDGHADQIIRKRSN